MSPPPGANNEYSRGSGGSRRPRTPGSSGGSGGSEGGSGGGSAGGSQEGKPAPKRAPRATSRRAADKPAPVDGQGAPPKRPAAKRTAKPATAKATPKASPRPKRTSKPATAKAAAAPAKPAARPRAPRRAAAAQADSASIPIGTLLRGVLAGALIGALLLIVAEFTALYQVHTANSALPVHTVSTGHNNSYALVPLALLAGALGFAVLRFGSRPALLGIGVIGLVALLIALVGDLPDAQATGLVGTPTSHFVSASSTPSAGLYLETLGAVVLILTSVLGFLMLGRPQPASQGRDGPPARRGGSRRPTRSVS